MNNIFKMLVVISLALVLAFTEPWNKSEPMDTDILRGDPGGPDRVGLTNNSVGGL